MPNTTANAAVDAIARRLGVRQKQLITILKSGQVKAIDETNTLYAIDDVVQVLGGLNGQALTEFKAKQRRLTTMNPSLYEDKFSALAPFQPPLAQVVEVKPQAPVLETEQDLLDANGVAELLNISVKKVKQLLRILSVPSQQSPINSQRLWRLSQINRALSHLSLEQSEMLSAWQMQYATSITASIPVIKPEPETHSRVYMKRSPEKREKENEELRELRDRIVNRVRVNVRERELQPASATLYVGPTNSGKTYTALNNLCSAYEQNPTGVHVYAGPLRMLAYEVYLKLVDRYGADKVGFLTGEEQINPEAPLLACTVEMAPQTGASLILDEAHWIADDSRGQHWTNLLLGSTYDDYHVLTAAEALPVIATLISDAIVKEEFHFARKTPLVFGGGLKLKDVPERSAVICFSRKTVYAVANMLEQSGKKVGVLYGALPLSARKKQIERYISGEYDIMVTTDVIGHGINLPIDNVIFAQTEKFDGVERRDLHIWEMAQIAGRAGRFGLSEKGTVYYLQGREWFSHDTKLINSGVQAGAGEIKTDLILTDAVITPQLNDLGIQHPTELLMAMNVWRSKALDMLGERPITASNLNDKRELLTAVAEPRQLPLYPYERNGHHWPLNATELWQLISGPYNPEGATVQKIFSWLSSENRATSNLLSTHLQDLSRVLNTAVAAVGNNNAEQVAKLEQNISSIGELKMAHVMFGQLGSLLYAELLEAEDRLNEALINTLHQAITAGTYGTCRNCGTHCSPWFNYCEPCFQSR